MDWAKAADHGHLCLNTGHYGEGLQAIGSIAYRRLTALLSVSFIARAGIEQQRSVANAQITARNGPGRRTILSQNPVRLLSDPHP